MRELAGHQRSNSDPSDAGPPSSPASDSNPALGQPASNPTHSNLAQSNLAEQGRWRTVVQWRRPASLLAIVTVVLWGVLAGRAPATDASRKGHGESAAVPVAVATARSTDVAVYLDGLGSVTASNTVTVKSRVDGQLMSLHFREGQLVKAGDLLAELDPRPFQVQVTQAEGELARDQAQLANARVDLERYRTLLAQDSITSQQLDTQQALVRQLAGSVEVDRGQLASARLQLTYSRITAPSDGRVGLRQVDVGNIIHATDTNGIVVITQLEPVYVLFAVPEDNVPRITKPLAAGITLKVEAWDRALQRRLATGALLTLDNQIDLSTGTIKLKAQFPNGDHALFPNQFVNVRLLIDTERHATVIPTAAILRGAQGTYAYVVRTDRTVDARPITTGVTQGNDTVIAAGIKVGERVVIDNTDKLRVGAKVALVRDDTTPDSTQSPPRPSKQWRSSAQRVAPESASTGRQSNAAMRAGGLAPGESRGERQ